MKNNRRSIQKELKLIRESRLGLIIIQDYNKRVRKLGLDVGKKSCGIAISDPLNIIAIGKENFSFPEREWGFLVDKVKEYLSREQIDTIIIGYPTYPSGDKSETTFLIEEFKDLLSSQVDLPIIFIDENGTTKQAHEVLIKAGLSRKKRKDFKDKIAAQLILESYLQRI